MTYRVFITGAGRDNVIAHMNQKPYTRGQPVTGDDTDLHGPYNTLANYIARALQATRKYPGNLVHILQIPQPSYMGMTNSVEIQSGCIMTINFGPGLINEDYPEHDAIAGHLSKVMLNIDPDAWWDSDITHHANEVR